MGALVATLRAARRERVKKLSKNFVAIVVNLGCTSSGFAGE